MAVYDEGLAPYTGAPRAGSIVNYAGAAMSLALIVGVSFWGYKLIMRDVSGIPVVRAMEGEMRVLPDNPGGELAVHTGLAVNEVAAVGEAGGPEDRLVLAPATAGLAEEDLELQPMAEAGDVSNRDESEEVPMLASMTVESEVAEDEEELDVLALADQIAAGLTPLDAAAAVDVIPASVPGIASSARPVLRPASLRVTAPAAAAPTAAPASTSEVAVTTTEFPVGTNLVQLGAFQTPALAAEEWSRLSGRFGQLMGGKERVIQVSNQSSGTWYRLRASGFDDRDDARRFCTALAAEGANCIAVLVN